MKNLKEYIIEGIFDIEDNIDNVDESVKDRIKQFLKDNFNGASSCKISDKPNVDGKYEVSCNKNIMIMNKKITSLTNGSFIWTNVGGNFYCSFCNSLTSLKGAPKKVGGDFDCSSCKSLITLEGGPREVSRGFYCNYCNSLTSLEGAPEKVGGDFYCGVCTLLTSLKGAPKKVGGLFDCNYCNSLTSLKGAPKEVGGHFDCSSCDLLTSLKGAPEKVGGNFYCHNYHINFTIDDIKKVSNIKGKIHV